MIVPTSRGGMSRILGIEITCMSADDPLIWPDELEPPTALLRASLLTPLVILTGLLTVSRINWSMATNSGAGGVGRAVITR